MMKASESRKVAESLLSGDESETGEELGSDNRMRSPADDMQPVTIRTETPSDRKDKRILDKILPSGMRLEVRYINDGAEEYCGQYGQKEIVRAGTIEAFVAKYLVPRFGHGEYALYLIKPNLDKESKGTIHIRKPLVDDEEEMQVQQTAKSESVKEVLGALMEFERSQREETARRESEIREKEERLNQRMQEIQEKQNTQFQELLQKRLLDNEESTAKKSSGSDSMLLMMMMQQQQQAARDMQLLIQSLKDNRAHTPEPQSSSLLTERILDKLNDLSQPQPQPMFHNDYPPIPQPSENITPKDILELVKGLKEQTPLPQPKEESGIFEKILPYVPMLQSVASSALDFLKNQSSEMKRQMEKLEDKLDKERERSYKPGGSELEGLLKSIELIEQIKERFSTDSSDYNRETPAENGITAKQVLDTISNMIPQIANFVKMMTVKNTGLPALPSPTEQPMITIGDVIKQLPNMNDEEVVQTLTNILESMKSNTAFTSQVRNLLTGNPDTDKKVIGKTVMGLLADDIKNGTIPKEQAQRIVRLATEHYETILAQFA